MKKALFLHMGPGLNAYVERQVFDNYFPEIYFWDQPKISVVEGAFGSLVEACGREINNIYIKTGHPISLFCHSFGGHLARACLEVQPEKIAKCLFVGTGFNVAEGFRLLLGKMVEDPDSPQPVKEEGEVLLKSLGASLSVSEVWKVLQVIFKDAQFLRHYWVREPAMQQYIEKAVSGPALDFQTFESVLNDFLKTKQNPRLLDWKGEIEILFGDQDPLLNLENEIRSWRSIFPKAKIDIRKNIGHYMHFESDIGSNLENLLKG